MRMLYKKYCILNIKINEKFFMKTKIYNFLFFYINNIQNKMMRKYFQKHVVTQAQNPVFIYNVLYHPIIGVVTVPVLLVLYASSHALRKTRVGPRKRKRFVKIETCRELLVKSQFHAILHARVYHLHMPSSPKNGPLIFLCIGVLCQFVKGNWMTFM